MNYSQQFHRGRLEMIVFSSFMILMSLILGIWEAMTWESGFNLGLQAVGSLALILILITSFLGFPSRWTTFMVLLLNGFAQFYLAGVRVGMNIEVELSDAGAIAYMLILPPLLYLGGAFYLAFSPTLGEFLKQRRQKFLLRRGEKADSDIPL